MTAQRGFVGRIAELASLSDVRGELERGRGAIVLVGGSAGIGKTRLVAEFRNALAGRRAPLVIEAECREDGGSTFGAIRTIVRALEPNAPAKLDALAGDARERDQFYVAVERLLFDAARKRRLVICIDDLHWADPATLDFLAFLAPHVESERVAIVATYRDDELETDPALARAFLRIARGRATRRIALKPLRDPEIRALLETLFAPADPSFEETQRDIVARAGGNPFYAEELLKSVLEGADRAALPLSIRSSVLARFDRLAEPHRDVLRHAALLGRRFDPLLLQTVLESNADDVASALREARAQYLIVEEPHESLSFRFRHALTQETIAAQLLAFEARPIHARVAQILESLPDASARVGEIAYHWWKAQNVARTSETNEAAGVAATAIHAYDDAASYFERALSVAASKPDELRLSMLAASAAAANGDHVRSAALFERALAIELGQRNFSNACGIIRKIVGRLTYDGRENEGRARIDAFLRAYRDDLCEVETLILEGYPILLILGDGGARAWLDRLRASAAARTAIGENAWLLDYLELNACAYLGDESGSRAAIDRLAPSFEKPHTLEDTLTIAAMAVGAGFAGVDPERTRESLGRARRLLDENGLASLQKYISVGDAFNRFLHGELAEAAAAAHFALGETYDRHQRMNVALVGASIGLATGDPKLVALATDDGILAMWRSGERSHRTALTATGIAEYALARGRTDEAAAFLERAVFALETIFATQFVLPLAARYVRTTSARERIFELLATLCDDDRAGHATSAMVCAIFAMRDGRADARDLAALAVEGYARLRWPLLEAQAAELAGKRRVVSIPATVVRRLSERERLIAELVAAGHGNMEIANRLGLSVKTVESHLTRTFAKLHLRSRAQLASYITSESEALRSTDFR